MYYVVKRKMNKLELELELTIFFCKDENHNFIQIIVKIRIFICVAQKYPNRRNLHLQV